MIEPVNTAPSIPEEFARLAFQIATEEDALFLTEGHLLLALLSSGGDVSASFRAAGLQPTTARTALKSFVPNRASVKSGLPTHTILRVSPGYREVLARAQGLAAATGGKPDEVCVGFALLWDPVNHASQVLLHLSISREDLKDRLVSIRPQMGDYQFPSTITVRLECLGSLSRSDFIAIAPAIREQLGSGAWQALTTDDDYREIWVDSAEWSADLADLLKNADSYRPPAA